jgi:hypothetical protein
MKHPNYPKATNQYLGTTTSKPLNQNSKEALQQTLLDFRIRLNGIIERKEKEKLEVKNY